MNTSGHSSFTFCSLSRSLEACAWSEQQPHSLDGPSAWDKKVRTVFAHSWSESFHNKRPGHWGNWQKKKKKIDSQRHWSTSYRRTQNDFICVCNLHLKWLPDKRYNLLSQYRSFPTSRTFRNNAATCRSFPEVPPPPPLWPTWCDTTASSSVHWPAPTDLNAVRYGYLWVRKV